MENRKQSSRLNRCILPDICEGDKAIIMDDMLNDEYVDSRSIVMNIKRRSRLCNMYPRWEHYNVRYNFYNYKKFVNTLSIPIQYKTPTIFLDGLYFVLPRSHINSIKKQAGKNKFQISVAIPKHDNNKMVQCFHNLDEFNKLFFNTNNRKFEIQCRYTKKATTTSLDIGKYPQSILDNKRSILCRTPELSEDEYPEPETGPIKLSKNPLVNKLKYVPFYKEDNSAIYMIMEIKQQYMLQILEGVIKQINTDNNMSRKIQQVISKIKSDYNDFRMSTIDMDLRDELNLEILLWIKCSLFTADENTSEISMKWKICNYEL